MLKELLLEERFIYACLYVELSYLSAAIRWDA